MNYEQANDKLQGRNSERRKIANNTYLIRYPDFIAVRLHDTNIVSYYPNGEIVLNTGGWYTNTTKARINEYSPARVYLDISIWYLMPDKIPFEDGMKIDASGNVISEINRGIVDDRKNLIKKINKYCRAIKNLDELPLPDNGDCWYCLFKDEKTGESMGESFGNTDHLISHLDEMYIHGSLIVNALSWRGYRDPYLIYRMNLRDSIVRAVRAYLKRQLGLA